LSAFVCLGNGVYRLSGAPRMHERPQAALFQALRELGYRVESEKGNDKLPVKIFCCRSRGNETQIEKAESGKRKAEMDQRLLTSSPTEKRCKVRIEDSSQFASALLLCAKVGGWKIEVVGENAEESSYVELTKQICDYFFRGQQAIKNNPNANPKFFFSIDADYSSQSYFWAAESMFGVSFTQWPTASPVGFQIDANFYNYIHKQLPQFTSKKTDLGDSIMTAIVLAPFAGYEVNFTDLKPLRLQETERVVALRTELTKCGAKVVEEGDTLTVYPSQLHGAEIKTYNDHRMAMCFAILGLKVPGIKIKNPACVKKTFPNFFQKLAAPPPRGLGATILDAKTQRKLAVEELFAD
jgi:3-phosphoshikimate 1-carboxyvinyltransferase